MELAKLKATATSVRRNILTMLETAGSGHPGGSLSAVELMVSLYFEHIKFDPAKPQSPIAIILSSQKAMPAPCFTLCLLNSVV